MKIINISGVIGWEVNAQDVRDALPTNGEEVCVHISSPGGYVSVGLEIFNMLRDYPGPISCVLKGYAMSMASYIPLAIPLNRHAPGKIYAEDNAIYMVHNARGYTGGDHNEILGYGESLKGMSNMIAKAYARRTGKTLDEVTAMMDRTTYLFGEQMKEHGFVDEILVTPDAEETDSETALVTARAIYEECTARMCADQARAQTDMRQVALALAVSQEVAPPAAAGISTTDVMEVQQMSIVLLATLLAANPTAKAEHDALVASARLDGEKAATTAAEARITAVAPFLSNAAYPQAVGVTAIKVLKGEMAQESLNAVVAAVDAVREENASNLAAAASAAAPATPGAPIAAALVDGVASDADGLAAMIAADKGGN